jgi:hypothetical protein
MIDPLAYTIAGACAAGGFGRTTAYELVAEGKLDARKIGGRTIILAESLRAYLASLPRADIRTGQPPSEPSLARLRATHKRRQRGVLLVSSAATVDVPRTLQ